METSTPASANTLHTTSVAAWDVPATVVAKERFGMKVGIKCSDECPLGGMAFGVYDHEGTCVAEGTASGEVWPGTTGLYFAEVDLEAPGEEGLYTWTVRNAPAAASEEGDAQIEHAGGISGFGVRVVSHPEYLVRVEAIDHDGQTPVGDARVVMHPYHAVTDARGVAELRVAKGSYTLFVSQTGYMIWGVPVEVAADVTTKAELQLQPVLERN